MGEKAFALAPVGAGPFEVVSDTLSSVLVLKKNPTYWQAGRPYLDTLTFKSVASDEAGYEALLAKEGQIYVDMSTPSLLQAGGEEPGRGGREPAQHVTVRPAAQYEDGAVQQRQGPAGHLRGHQLRADPAARIRQHVPARPGVHRTRRDLLPARRSPVTRGTTRPWPRRWSSQSGLDKVTINLGTIQNLVAEETTEALQTEWAAVGIKTVIHAYALAPLIAQFVSGKWQSMIQTAGSYDPAAGVGVGFRFSSVSPFSGVHDPHLDSLLNQAAALTSLSQRCAIYTQAANYIASNYYGPFYFAFAPANVAVKGVVGPGLTEPLPAVVVTPTILWEDVAYSS